ncbi:hypothetical protein SPRG_07967 [Saprolegnia parasitica CBS 223.65]|uniref:PRA1 family protein n=1 Tax=Saprolegnia parasitica (strain CBS 223.65) TaxID=695850 RepID=A0A067C7S0_SAPPC|nr:hypothetical protein SPRG_07967 [Saprolegnia parasitica CBS 223.65]KDO26563.1 hypothetical protein SPRG_07967 [Saprolegnia parasitica CBS 223.65]|eukprot:XP_012202705.1 hypothetical protein SPRG_07967 [Saprolegnia parasitica CBS 223.65]
MERTSSGKGDSDDVKIHSLVGQALASVQHKINIHSIRSLFSFMGIGEEHPFSVLLQAQLVVRLRRNLEYFLVNYILVFGLVFFCVLIFHPFAMLCGVATLGAWVTVLVQRKQIQLLLGPSVKMIYVVYGLAAGRLDFMFVVQLTNHALGTALVLIFSLLSPLLLATTTPFGVHALLRNTPASDKVDVVLDDHP